MSGWRSGSGSDHDPALIHRSFRAGRLPSRRDANPVSLAILIVVAVAVVGLAWYSREMHRPPRRVLPPPLHAAVLVVPIGGFPADRLRDLPHDYAAAYGLSSRS